METLVSSPLVSDQNLQPGTDTGAVDTHCHLFLLDHEPAQVVETAKAAGVDRLICVGVDPATSARSAELADSLEGVFATAGMHPHDASDFDQAASARIEELLHDARVIGVGECGLDYFRMHSPAEDQIRVLQTHIALSNETGKPMVVHVRDAWPDVDLDRIVVETDSPFLSPQKLRGSNNEPSNVMLTIAEIARVRDDDVEKIVTATAENARSAFPGLR